VFLSGGLARLPFLLGHARRTAAIIQQNVVLALALKGAFLTLAFLGWATLWMAVLADMGATLLVTFNGLRLLHARGN
jgi:Cd2+/Zn2+-exporting ATPase